MLPAQIGAGQSRRGAGWLSASAQQTSCAVSAEHSNLLEQPNRQRVALPSNSAFTKSDFATATLVQGPEQAVQFAAPRLRLSCVPDLVEASNLAAKFALKGIVAF